jgi:hypothetical protein
MKRARHDWLKSYCVSRRGEENVNLSCAARRRRDGFREEVAGVVSDRAPDFYADAFETTGLIGPKILRCAQNVVVEDGRSRG